MADKLWKSGDAAEYRTYLVDYATAIDDLQKKDLAELDSWFREELPSTLKARKEGESGAYLTGAELVKLVQWKLARGKFRPGLLNYAKGHTDEAVRQCTGKALAELAAGQQVPTQDAVQAAVQELTKLKGVGPATATAVLAAADPSVPFMSDEVLVAVLGSTPKQYTWKTYQPVLEGVRDKAAQLSQGSTSDQVWTAAEVERSLYCAAVRDKLNAQLKKPAAKKQKR